MRGFRQLCLVLIVLLIGLTILRWGQWICVEGVRVVGVHHLSSQYVSQLTQIVLGANMLRLDLRGVRDRAIRDPWVEDARVTRDVVSRVVSIEIREREPVGRVQLEGGRTVWIDAEGVVLGPAESAALSGVRAVGGQVSHEVVAAAAAVKSWDDTLLEKFPSFDASDLDCVVARGEAVPQGLCGPIGELPSALATLGQVARAKDLSAFEEVDLRWGSEVFLKP
ncbi:MAG: FtsQ-type POTRA domain-containing protein [Candidatus Bipolaricaulota bacterium]